MNGAQLCNQDLGVTLAAVEGESYVKANCRCRCGSFCVGYLYAITDVRVGPTAAFGVACSADAMSVYVVHGNGFFRSTDDGDLETNCGQVELIVSYKPEFVGDWMKTYYFAKPLADRQGSRLQLLIGVAKGAQVLFGKGNRVIGCVAREMDIRDFLTDFPQVRLAD